MPRPTLLLLLLTAACTLPPATAAPAAASDLRADFVAFGLPPRSQGPRPTCSIFTTVAAFEFACARATGHGERLSVEYANWAANAATGRTCDGDFFHHALAGYERFGLCPEAAWPYAAQFDTAAAPSPDALVAAGRQQAGSGARLRVRWIRPNDGAPGLSPAQFTEVVATLARGWPVAAGSGHSRLLVGFTPDPAATGGGTFTTLDSALARFDAVPAAFVRDEVCDAFVVELAEAGR